MSNMSDYDKSILGVIIADRTGAKYDWYDADLVRLIIKADAPNLAILAKAYPEYVASVKTYQEGYRYCVKYRNWSHMRVECDCNNKKLVS